MNPSPGFKSAFALSPARKSYYAPLKIIGISYLAPFFAKRSKVILHFEIWRFFKMILKCVHVAAISTKQKDDNQKKRAFQPKMYSTE